MAVKRRRTGRGVVNKIIDALPFEAHVPGYKFLGPGTRLQQRLSRGDVPINGLDAAARAHDIAYSKTTDTKERNKADLILADQAWERVKASDSSLGERLAAWATTNAMKLKAKLGAGVKRRRKRRTGVKKSGGRIGGGGRKRIEKKGGRVKKGGKKKKRRAVTRVIPVPMTSGGNVRGALSRIGMPATSMGPAIEKIRAVVGTRKKNVKLGEGLYLRPYRRGYGLYLRPYRRSGLN